MSRIHAILTSSEHVRERELPNKRPQLLVAFSCSFGIFLIYVCAYLLLLQPKTKVVCQLGIAYQWRVPSFETSVIASSLFAPIYWVDCKIRPSFWIASRFNPNASQRDSDIIILSDAQIRADAR